MRLEQLSVALRQRDPWEAGDAGIALWRKHFGAVLRPWLALSLPVFVLVATFAWSLDAIWVGWLIMWWLKPWFDRVPLYVLSRAAFGTVPRTLQVLRARELFRPGLIGWLTFRRLHPARALLLPVDLLEGVSGHRRSTRAAVLLRAVGAQAFGMLAGFLALEMIFLISIVALSVSFIPIDLLPETTRAVYSTLFESPPMWARLLMLSLWWLSVSLVEPAYVASGFGLYLHRRTQLEAWDVELVFRRLAARARAMAAAAAALLPAALLCTALALSLASAPAMAQSKGKDAKPPPVAPAEVYGDGARPASPKFEQALDKAYSDPSLQNKQKVTRWELRTPNAKDKEKDKKNPEAGMPNWIAPIVMVIGAIGEYGLWFIAGILLLILLWRLPKWLPWVKAQLRDASALPEIHEEAVVEVEPLPDDVPTAVGKLWREGRRRDALALLYRASVERLSARLGTPFPPGATEADCLRRARRLEDEEARGSFTSVVRTWQRAAYARQFPADADFDELVAGWARKFPGQPA